MQKGAVNRIRIVCQELWNPETFAIILEEHRSLIIAEDGFRILTCSWRAG